LRGFHHPVWKGDIRGQKSSKDKTCAENDLLLACWNFKCPHNLFWEKLMLDADKIHSTKKALEMAIAVV
jgi:hypothetical protein